MADTYLGEIRLFPYQQVDDDDNISVVVPLGWTPCDGRSLPVARNQALYALIGNSYGGNSINFNLPDLRGRVPVCFAPAAGFPIGTAGGSESVSLKSTEMPSHTHSLQASTSVGTVAKAVGNLLAAPVESKGTEHPIYGPASTPLVPLQATGAAGAAQPHDNMQPFVALTYAIATSDAEYPSNSDLTWN